MTKNTPLASENATEWLTEYNRVMLAAYGKENAADLTKVESWVFHQEGRTVNEVAGLVSDNPF